MNHSANQGQQGPPRYLPRPFFDVFRPHLRVPDESNGLVGGLRRDVAPPYWPPISLAPPNPHPGPMGMLPGPMAQEEEGDFMLGEKLLKKPKRIRTRVDAGEPRNPYSAFGSFPNLCGVSVNSVRTSSVPNSLFGGSPTFCGLPFVNYLNPQNNIGTRGMLSELFGGGPTKSMVSCPPEDRSMGVLDKVNSNNVHSSDSMNSVIRGPEAENVLLREILQGRKRDLLTMEDLEAARSLHNNNISYKSDRSNSEREEMSSRDGGRHTNSANALTVSEDETRCESEVEDAVSPRPTSPGSDCDSKKNRLENIVNVIRSSPTPPTPVNGCKKRKLYLPQQHEARTQVESPEEGSESPNEPENKSRRVDEGSSSPSRQENTEDDRGLQIDLTVRNEERTRRSPGATPRSSSPKPPATSSANDPTEASSYLLDYAKHLIRSQSLQREADNKSSSELSEKLNLLRSFSLNSQVTELIEGLADVLKTEITASLAVIIDSIVNKYVQQRKLLTKQAEAAAEQLNRDIASQLIERSRSPRPNNILNNNNNTSKERNSANQVPRINGMPPSHGALNLAPYGPSENNLNSLNLPHLRPQLHKGAHGFFQGNLPTTGSSVPLGQTSPYASLPPEPEQDEALSLVVTPKKKRHKVTDSRLTPRTVGRLLEDLPRYPHMPPLGGGSISPRGSPPPHSLIHPHAPPRPSFPQPPPPLLPVSLPTSVAIPNPSLHDTGLLYPTYYRGTSSPSEPRRDESPASHHPPHHHPLLHPALLAASSPDSFSHFLRGADHDRTSDCSPADNHYEGVQPPISFYGEQRHWNKRALMYGLPHPDENLSHSSTLTPMHLRKAKLMFFYVRYPSSSVLKTFFPDIKFNKNNTAQLVKWFSNFREFYYIQMEKYARQAISEGIKTAEELTVSLDSELIRVLNLHYNRNNHLEIPEHFRYVVEQTLREFFKAIQEGKDNEQSWKKAIYKIIARMDESVPEYFKSPSFLDQLE